MSFIISKIFWVFTSPANLLVLVLLCGAFLGMSNNAKAQQTGRRLCFFVALLLFFIGIFPVGDWIVTPLENSFSTTIPDHVDGLIVLGGDEMTLISELRHQPTAPESASRYIAFAAMARKFPNAKLVFSGGSGRLLEESTMKDSEVARQALASLGVPVERMAFEDQSRNTHENAIMSAALVHPEPQQNWLLFTSAFHMPRALLCFQKAGWHVYAAPADYKSTGIYPLKLKFDLVEHLATMTFALHEYYGLISYWLMGYTDHPWPAH